MLAADAPPIRSDNHRGRWQGQRNHGHDARQELDEHRAAQGPSGGGPNGPMFNNRQWQHGRGRGPRQGGRGFGQQHGQQQGQQHNGGRGHGCGTIHEQGGAVAIGNLLQQQAAQLSAGHQREVAGCNARIKELQQDKQLLQTQLTDTQEQLQESEREKAKYRRERNTLRLQVATGQKRCGQAQAGPSRPNPRLTELERANAVLRAQLQNQKAGCEDLAQENEELWGFVDSVQAAKCAFVAAYPDSPLKRERQRQAADPAAAEAEEEPAPSSGRSRSGRGSQNEHAPSHSSKDERESGGLDDSASA